MTETQADADRRVYERTEIDELAGILYADGRTRLPCRVLDYSDGGVLLKVAAAACLPSEFILLAGKPETRIVCRIAWRSGSRAGCQFLGRIPGQGHNGDWIMPTETESAKREIRSHLLKHPLSIV